MPANGRLANTEFELYNGEEPVFVMRKALESLKTVFDYIIVDCPPSLGMLTVNSLTASDGVVVPMQCEFYALEGLSQLVQTTTAASCFPRPSRGASSCPRRPDTANRSTITTNPAREQRNT